MREQALDIFSKTQDIIKDFLSQEISHFNMSQFKMDFNDDSELCITCNVTVSSNNPLLDGLAHLIIIVDENVTKCIEVPF